MKRLILISFLALTSCTTYFNTEVGDCTFNNYQVHKVIKKESGYLTTLTSDWSANYWYGRPKDHFIFINENKVQCPKKYNCSVFIDPEIKKELKQSYNYDCEKDY